MTHRFLSRARIEFDDAADWYEAKRPGLGDEFVAEVYATVLRILAQPQGFARYPGTPRTHDVRFLAVNRFDYVVIYEPTPTEVVVISVAHTKRNRRPWRRLQP